MSQAKNIRDQIIRQLKPQMELLKKHCEEELRNVIEAKIYSRPEGEYKRTMQLLNSVTSTNVILEGDTFSFKVYLDPDKMHHFSIAGEEAKGIKPGDEVYVVPLVEYSHGGLFYRKGTPFMDEYIKEIEEDLNQAMVKYIIKKFETKSYKK